MGHYDFAIMGKGNRLQLLQKQLEALGLRCCSFPSMPTTAEKKELLSSAPVLVGGFPFLQGNAYHIRDFKRLLRSHSRVFGGMLPEELKEHCRERGIPIYDFLEDCKFAYLNSVATAEGVLCEAHKYGDCLLHKSSCLVLGFGRCGKAIAYRLKQLCSQVAVCTNDSAEQGLAGAMGFEVVTTAQLASCLQSYTYIFNTIPACILNASLLKLLDFEKTCVLDIASNRTGADYEFARENKLPLHYCPGLPDHYGVSTIAAYLCQYICDH